MKEITSLQLRWRSLQVDMLGSLLSIEKKFNVMITDLHAESVISVDDFIPYRKMITTAVEMLCHYHPVGVYYYVRIPLSCQLVTSSIKGICKKTIAL